MRALRVAVTATLAALILVVGVGDCKGKILGPPEIKDVVNIIVDSSGFNPSTIYAKRGKPITMVFNRTEEHTCATEVVIASEHIRKELPMNAQIPVVFLPEKAGDIKFACPMNMVVGTIKVLN